MASELSLLTSTSFLERGSPEALNDLSQSTSPASSPSIVSPQEAKVRDWEDQGRYSPGAVVAGRLAGLAIRGDFHHQLPDRSLHHSTTFIPFLQANRLSNRSTLHGSHDMHESDSSEATELLSPSLINRAPTPTPTGSAEPQPEIPETPVNTLRQPSISPRKRKSAPASAKVRNPSRSPSPPGAKVEDLLTWSDSEITGHDPTDPDDDGYGINGIGFKPTAAIAWARSQKRKQQVAEWKNREAREARERRRERRVGDNMNKLRTVHSGAIQKKVKFDV
ncbi:uncharacterized protein DSM5745_03431 [Aspergillus mulundensis]|uniref:Uncharacterized protein n=1 Tax=Aspergillus mulundensis TaxID=1810919 RepID=A0A3D8SKC0_9EURO|nr:Uncharacterized protein DSM5745_03431 [Aspergillus mulundensis]RDW86789.1 Uncharacterized protein DSM5745_03431 [Aspergillus mulundensis]